MASSQEPGPNQIQDQLKGDISNNLKEDLHHNESHHWDIPPSHKIECPGVVKGGAQSVEFQEKGPEPFKAALVYKFTINGVTQRWMFAWKSPPPAAYPTNKVLTKLYYDWEPIEWPLIGEMLEDPSTTNKSSYTQGGAMVHFTAPPYGTSDFKAEIKYA